ncbi:MAG: alpha/beta hydrolase [Pseudomonadota bacterium]
MIPAYSPDEMSDLYNNQKWVPDFADYVVRWRARSRAARSGIRHHADIVYGAGARNRIDLFLPESANPAPLLIFAHGGYWQALGKEDWSCIAAPYVARGIAVAVPGYTLCPETTVSGITEEIRDACAFLYLNAGDYRIDRENFTMSGHSAGGHLTAMMLATDWPARDARLPARLFQRGVVVSGLFDLEPLTITFLNKALKLTSAQALACSPIFLPPQSDAPMLVVVGGAETAEFLRQSKSMVEAWAGTAYREEPGFNHFSVIDAFHDPAAPLFTAVCDFIDTSLVK